MRTEIQSGYDTWHDVQARGGAADPLACPWYETAYRGIRDSLRGELLEVGCGRGEFATWLADSVPEVHVTGLDFSTTAIAVANARPRLGRRPARFLIGDAQALPLTGDAFDWVVSCECMEHVPNPRRMASEIFRVLRPGGRFCLTTENYANGMLLAWIHSWMTGRPFDSGSGIQPIENFFVFFRVRKFLADAGLKLDRTESSHYQWLLLPGIDPARLCTARFRSRWAGWMAKPFGRHYSFFGHKPE